MDYDWEYGYENMDRSGEGPMMIGRPLEEIRENMRLRRETFPEVHYALRRRPVGRWETVEETALAPEPRAVVWQLEHDGRGTTLHATADHAKAYAEQAEPGGDTYWRYDDGTHWLKRNGETIATIRPVEVLGAGTAKEESDDG